MKNLHQNVMDSVGHKYSLMKAEALGNVYFQCWRFAQDEVKDSFEEICIQDLMFRLVCSFIQFIGLRPNVYT